MQESGYLCSAGLTLAMRALLFAFLALIGQLKARRIASPKKGLQWARTPSAEF